MTDAIREIERVTRGRGPRQALGLDAARRHAVELRAVDVVEVDFTARGWVATDVSAISPYDLLCRRDDQVRRVEVKGTTGAAGIVLLTKNEVSAARADPASTILAVVHGIEVLNDAERATGIGWPTAAGRAMAYRRI